MRNLKKTGLLLMTCVGVSHAAQANESTSSAIHKAAAERLQKKLGTIRGTIKPAAQNVFLTEFMIEQLKPIEIKSDDERAELDSQRVDRNIITNAIGQDDDFVTLAGQGDLDDLTSAVDKMIDAQE
jgi:hypothetical protein